MCVLCWFYVCTDIKHSYGFSVPFVGNHNYAQVAQCLSAYRCSKSNVKHKLMYYSHNFICILTLASAKKVCAKRDTTFLLPHLILLYLPTYAYKGRFLFSFSIIFIQWPLVADPPPQVQQLLNSETKYLPSWFTRHEAQPKACQGRRTDNVSKELFVYMPKSGWNVRCKSMCLLNWLRQGIVEIWDTVHEKSSESVCYCQ